MNTAQPAGCAYGHRDSRLRRRPAEGCRPLWEARLPAEWRRLVVPPESFRVYREFEIPARRVLGYSAAGDICFCAHDFRLTALRSDDDEDFYESLDYSESVSSWRLGDGRWLVRRTVAPLGGDEGRIASVGVEDEMPR